MARLSVLALALMFSGLASSPVFALGADYSRKDLEEKGQLVKGQKPVHGYWVNWEDVFFYAGDTTDLNRFLESYGKLRAVKRKVVIHAGAKKARSPWDKADRDIATDWSLYRLNTGTEDEKKPAPSRVDVWLGSRIKLDDLRIPDGVEVESGGEVDKFIERLKKDRKERQQVEPPKKSLSPDEAVKQAKKVSFTVEYDVGSVGVLTGATRAGDDPRLPIVVRHKGKLADGGRFYVMLWGNAVGDSGQRAREFEGKRVRVTGHIQVADPGSASTDYYMTIDDPEKIKVVK